MLIYEIYQNIFENRVEVIKSKLGPKLQAKIDSDSTVSVDSDEFVDNVVEIDPSKNNKYVQWLLTNYLKGEVKAEDLYKSKEDLIKFEKFKNKIGNKDINKYTPKSLYDTVKDFKEEEEVDYADMSDKQRKKHIDNTGMEGADLVIDGSDAKVYKLNTKEAACKLGSGTRWCTATRSDDNRFDNYNKDGPMYVIITNDGRKYQFHFETGQFMDEEDEEIGVNELRNKYPSVDRFVQSKLSEIAKTGNVDAIEKMIDLQIASGRWDEAEPAIKKDPYLAYQYAKDIIKGRWPEAEPDIMKYPKQAYQYAEVVIKGRWPEAEPVIMKDPYAALQYAKYVIKGRWPEAEPYIMKDPKQAYQYAEYVIKGRWPEAEPVIMKDPKQACQYAKYVIKGPWPEAEPVIMKDPYAAHQYAKYVIKGRWPEAEPVIMKDPIVASQYAEYVIKGPWPEAGIE